MYRGLLHLATGFFYAILEIFLAFDNNASYSYVSLS